MFKTKEFVMEETDAEYKMSFDESAPKTNEFHKKDAKDEKVVFLSVHHL